MKRLRGWGTVAVISVLANVAWQAAGRKFPAGPIGQLQARLRSASASSSSTKASAA